MSFYPPRSRATPVPLCKSNYCGRVPLRARAGGVRTGARREVRARRPVGLAGGRCREPRRCGLGPAASGAAGPGRSGPAGVARTGGAGLLASRLAPLRDRELCYARGMEPRIECYEVRLSSDEGPRTVHYECVYVDDTGKELYRAEHHGNWILAFLELQQTMKGDGYRIEELPQPHKGAHRYIG